MIGLFAIDVIETLLRHLFVTIGEVAQVLAVGSADADVEDVSSSLFNKLPAEVTTLCLHDSKPETTEMEFAVPLKMFSK